MHTERKVMSKFIHSNIAKIFEWVLRHHVATIIVAGDDAHTLIVQFIFLILWQDCE
jgi:hypothetical protein